MSVPDHVHEKLSQQVFELNLERAKLRTLLLDLYVASMLWRDDLPDDEQDRLLTTVLAAAEGRPFEPLGLPFPRARP